MTAARIVGDGMIGRACRLCFPDNLDVTFYAAGVSDSGATDYRDFERERFRLTESFDPAQTLVYFSTCSTDATPYVAHKRAMEDLVQQQPSWLILRLPIVAGRSANPHTLLNYLYARISRSERFVLQQQARRNIIGVGDMVQIVEALLNAGISNEIVNVAAPMTLPMRDIVAEFEHLTGKQAVMDTVDFGTSQDIDIARMMEIHQPIDFGRNYLRRTLTRYYG